MAAVPKCCASASRGPTSQYLKPQDQLFSSLSLHGNATLRTMASVLPEEGKKLNIGTVKSYACSSTATIQSTAHFDSNLPCQEGTFSSIQFAMLMENLNEIVEILGSKELELSEQDKVPQIKQLGTLTLFHDHLSRSLASPPFLKPDYLQYSKVPPLEKPKDKVTIVRSGKSQERKLKRIKGLHKRMTDAKPVIFKDVEKSQKFQQRILSFRWRNVKRFTSKQECEFAEGVKVASELQRIREVIEKEIGQPISYADWAKAAKIDTRTLSQQLLHGSYCRNQLVECTQPLVKYLVKKYIGIGIAPDSLLQAGILGVLRGAEKFDSKKGRKFSAYIGHWIKKAVFEQIAQNSRIFRMSIRAEGMVQKIEKAQRELHFILGRSPSNEETAKFTGFTLANVRLAKRCSRSIWSLEQPIGHESGLTLEDLIPGKSGEGPTSIKRKQLRDGLLFILEELNPREKQIIAQRYGLDDGICRSLEEIGKHFHVTKEWIRTLEKGAIAKLRREEIKNDIRILLCGIEKWC